VIIIETGLGSCSSEWVAAQRLISQFARIYTYDRAGDGQSKAIKSDSLLPPSARPPTAAKRCAELTKLLEVTNTPPPWVIIGHSYGGVLVREFLVKHGKEKVKGMVILDSSVTRTKLPENWPTLLGDHTYFEVVGLEQNRCVTDEEWQQIKKDDTENQPAAAIEESYMEDSTRAVNQAVNGKQLLGAGPLSIIFANESVDFQKVYDYSVKNGTGTSSAREAMRKRLEDMEEIDETGQRAHLGLSSQRRFVYAEGIARTHNVHFVQPQLIVDEVRWVLSGLNSL